MQLAAGAEWIVVARRALSTNFAAERNRWVLWIPVGLSLGIAVYFALPFEPPLYWGPGTVLVLISVGIAGWAKPDMRHGYPLLALICAGTIAVGFTVAQIRTAMVNAPMITQHIGPTLVFGQVSKAEVLEDGIRLILDHPRIEGLDPDRSPKRIRLRLRGMQPAFRLGDWVQLPAVLMPPPPPALPGAFDFQRQSFFGGIGAVGYAIGSLEVKAEATTQGIEAWEFWLERTRRSIAARVQMHANGATAAVVVALMTGERGAIPSSVMEAIRDSGIAHLLAISGLHIGLVAGFLFVSLRGALALVPPLAVRYPIKKLAVIASILGAGAYMLVAGASVPSQRAFVMVALVLLAMLVDRRGISMRMVVWAATLILIVKPESLLGASFQLSFAAVSALVAVYEVIRGMHLDARRGAMSNTRRLLVYLGGVALTTLVAGIATAPFVIFHFNRFADYWLVTNMVAVPITAFWIMPWGVAAFILMPLGLEALAIAPMGWGVDVVIRLAEIVSEWPGAVSSVPPMPTWGLALIALGGVWIFLWRQRWRLWGGAGIAAGVAAVLTIVPPDILVDGRGKLLAVRTADGDLSLSSSRVAPFIRQSWLRHAGQRTQAWPWPRYGFSRDGQLGCDLLGCIYRASGQVVALVVRSEALLEDCKIAQVIVSRVVVDGPCPAAHTIIDSFDLWKNGGYALWLKDGQAKLDSVNGLRGVRPWVIRPG